MSQCGYGHGVSQCLHVDTDMECLHISMCVSMFICGYVHGVSPCLYVDTDKECLLVSMWIWKWNVPCGYGHVSMRIMTQGVFMLPCGYGHALSPCFHVDMDMEWLHVSIWI